MRKIGRNYFHCLESRSFAVKHTKLEKLSPISMHIVVNYLVWVSNMYYVEISIVGCIIPFNSSNIHIPFESITIVRAMSMWLLRKMCIQFRLEHRVSGSNPWFNQWCCLALLLFCLHSSVCIVETVLQTIHHNARW